jgi:hypothetical protein
MHWLGPVAADIEPVKPYHSQNVRPVLPYGPYVDAGINLSNFGYDCYCIVCDSSVCPMTEKIQLNPSINVTLPPDRAS